MSNFDSNSGHRYETGEVPLVLVDENRIFKVENEKMQGPNDILFKLITSPDEKWYVVGCCLLFEQHQEKCARADVTYSGETTRKDAALIAE